MKKFAFLVHPRDNRDFLRRFPYLSWLPERVLRFLTRNMPPVVVSHITGLKDTQGNDVPGMIIAVTMTARQMMEEREAAAKKIIQASKFAEKRGVGVIGFGALTASLSKGGLDVLPHLKTMGVTTGRIYTIKTVTDYVKKCIVDFGFSADSVKIAIVGAGGSIGSGCAKILAEYGVQHMLFIDVQKRAEHLKDQVEHLKGMHGDRVNIEVSHAISSIKGWDIVITATNSPEAVLSSEDILPGTIIVNDAQPSDVPSHIIRERDDILVIEGGVITTPGIKCNFNLGLADREDTFCCLGEVLILAHNQKFDHFTVGEADTKLLPEIIDMGKQLGFRIAKFQNAPQRHIPEQQIQKVQEIIKSRLAS